MILQPTLHYRQAVNDCHSSWELCTGDSPLVLPLVLAQVLLPWPLALSLRWLSRW